MPLTIQDVYAFVRSSLGAPTTEVELEDSHIQTCLALTTNLLSSKVPRHYQTGFRASPGQMRYKVNIPGCMGIHSVEFLDKFQLGIQDASDNDFILTQSVISNQTDVAPYAQYLTYRKDARKVYSADPDWKTQWEPDKQNNNKRTLFLYISVPPYSQYYASATVAMRYTPDDDDITGLVWVPEGLEYWVKAYCLAECKILYGGRILDKFKGIPGPDSPDMQLNGEEIRMEGIEQRQELLTDIDGRQRQLPVIYG